MFVVPDLNSPERATFENTIVGTLNRVDGGFDCLGCSPVEDQDDPCKVYGVNIAPYSQRCCLCGQLIVDGQARTCLYDGPGLTLKEDRVVINTLRLAIANTEYDDEIPVLTRILKKLTIMMEDP